MVVGAVVAAKEVEETAGAVGVAMVGAGREEEVGWGGGVKEGAVAAKRVAAAKAATMVPAKVVVMAAGGPGGRPGV